ncbi:hypothetical protein [Fibrella arboris]|uniref:hypothetical protein n=1 Tax=Fibrella arboris TaxID=3242486 RepID=UPI003521A01C
MEKQPVDDLFARKLRDAETKVSADVFNQLEQRMGVKPLPVHKKVVGWWQIAAAACLILAIGLVYNLNKADVQLSQSHTIVQTSSDKTARSSTSKLAKSQQQQIKKQNESARPTTNAEKATYLALQSGMLHKKDRSQVTVALESEKSMLRNKLAERQQERATEVTATVDQEDRRTPTPQLALASTTIDKVDRISMKPNQAVERTIILTIEDNQTAVHVAAHDDASKMNRQGNQKGLSGLFGKLKQLKNGEVLAKATLTEDSQVNHKNRFGRVFNEVKESLKNETTLE